MVKQCNIYGQSVQLINYDQVWFQKYYYAYEHLYGILILTPNLQVVYTKSIYSCLYQIHINDVQLHKKVQVPTVKLNCIDHEK